MKINVRTQHFACAIFLLLSFQSINNASINITKTRSSRSSDDRSSSKSSDDSSSSKRSSSSSSRSSSSWRSSSQSKSDTSSKTSSSNSESKTKVSDSPASVKTEAAIQQKESRSSNCASTRAKDDEDYERRQADYDDRCKQEERKKREDDEQWTRDWEERDAAAHKRAEEKRLAQIEFAKTVQAKTVIADIPAVVQAPAFVPEKTESIEAIPTHFFTTVDVVSEEKFKEHPKDSESTQQEFLPSKTIAHEIKIDEVLIDRSLKEKTEKVENERSEQSPADQEQDQEIEEGAIKVFIPTREFYENNKEYLACVKKVRGCPVFIPENIQSGVDAMVISNNYYHGAHSNSAYFSSDMHSGSFDSDPWGKKNKNVPTRAQIMSATLAALAQTAGASGLAVAAGVGGVSITLTGPLIPVIIGTVVVGYVATVIIPGLQRPVCVMIEPNTQNMTKEQYEQYLQAKKQQEDLEKQQIIIRQSRQANDLVFKNGVFAGCAQNKTINLDPVDPQLMYGHGPLQRALDISSAVAGSSDRFAVVDGKVIKFSLQQPSNLHYVHQLHAKYEATVVEDFGKLSKKDLESLRKFWNFEAKKKDKEKKKQQRQSGASGTSSSSGPGQDPDDDKDKKNKKKTDETFDKEKYQHDRNKFSENPNDITHMFHKALNKLEDSITNRQQVLEMVKNKDNCCGLDNNGVISYVRIQSDGSQLWAEINPLKQIVRNCGNNPSGQHRIWNSITGLKQAPYKI